MKKFSPMRFTAPTEEAALSGALQLVGASLDEADYEVLETGPKGVTVRVKPKSPTSAPVAEATPVEEEAAENAPVENAPSEDEVAQIAAEAAEFEDDETFSEAEIEDVEELIDSEIEAETAPLDAQFEEELDSDDDFGAEENQDEDMETEELEAEEAEETEAPAQNAAPELVSRAQETAQSILDRMNLNAQISVVGSESAQSIQLVAQGEDIGILIGKQGATLQSFQYILNLTLNNGAHSSEGVRVTVDAGNYRARRQSSLEQTARMAAQRARASGRPVRLEPMPAAERRIIHMYLQSERGIVTQSEGREPQRRLVVSPDENAAPGMGQSRFENRAPRGNGGGFNRGGERGGRGRGFRR